MAQVRSPCSVPVGLVWETDGLQPVGRVPACQHAEDKSLRGLAGAFLPTAGGF